MVTAVTLCALTIPQTVTETADCPQEACILPLFLMAMREVKRGSITTQNTLLLILAIPLQM